MKKKIFVVCLLAAMIIATLASKEYDVIFGGRLGQYKYYDMAPVIEEVLSIKDIERL